MPKEFSGYQPLSDIKSGGLGTSVRQTWGEAKEALSAPGEYLTAGGNRLLTTVRVVNLGLKASEVAQEEPELPKYVRLASAQPG